MPLHDSMSVCVFDSGLRVSTVLQSSSVLCVSMCLPVFLTVFLYLCCLNVSVSVRLFLLLSLTVLCIDCSYSAQSLRSHPPSHTHNSKHLFRLQTSSSDPKHKLKSNISPNPKMHFILDFYIFFTQGWYLVVGVLLSGSFINCVFVFICICIESSWIPSSDTAHVLPCRKARVTI